MRTKFHKAALMALMTLAHTFAAGATPLPEDLSACGQATVTRVLDGARFTAKDGNTVRLAMVKAPELWGKGAAYKSWPYAREARDALAKLIKGQTLTLACEGKQTDRLGERVAAVVLPDGSWLQEKLVAMGAVLVFPSPRRHAGLTALYKAEDAARAKRLGLWRYKSFRAVPAKPGNVRPGWFQIVRGKVTGATRVGDTVYLNFGPTWRSDVTAEIPVRALRTFRAQGLDPLTLTGATVELRGFVDQKSGPRLIVPGPGRLRVLERTNSKAR
ncbi:thermonuclease family protein [Kordiimonas marina]|uniref:thermonuclease family protein n=1 Tax=Kordiimonas marina TaxID=2872312 RepID=UPI001FF238B3|nr:thermonuclease family protein [Kordiimonas marina]MCJ9428159.1 thermonuclease family protein [Kordiimonas marina]